MSESLGGPALCILVALRLSSAAQADLGSTAFISSLPSVVANKELKWEAGA